MSTVAQTYASKFSTAMAAKPAPFVANGKDVALVTPDGNMALVGATLTPDQAADLRKWIKQTFMPGGVL